MCVCDDVKDSPRGNARFSVELEGVLHQMADLHPVGS